MVADIANWFMCRFFFCFYISLPLPWWDPSVHRSGPYVRVLILKKKEKTTAEENSSASGHRWIIHRWSHTFCDLWCNNSYGFAIIHLYDEDVGWPSLNSRALWKWMRMWSTHSIPHFDIIYIRCEIILNTYLHVNRHHHRRIASASITADRHRSSDRSLFWSRAQRRRLLQWNASDRPP